MVIGEGQLNKQKARDMFTTRLVSLITNQNNAQMMCAGLNVPAVCVEKV